MRPFTENPEAKWLPGRHNLAVFRLLASLVLMFRGVRTPEPAADSRTAYVIDRHQSAFENFTMALLFNSFIAACLAAWLQPALALSSAALLWMLPLLFVLAPGVYQLFFHPFGLLLAFLVRSGAVKMKYVVGIQTWTCYLIVSAIAWLTLSVPTWIRWVGILWFTLLTVNAAAAVVMLAIGPRIKSLEERMGGGSFDVSFWDSAA